MTDLRARELLACPNLWCEASDPALVEFQREGSGFRWHRVECRSCGMRGPETQGCSLSYWGAVRIDEVAQEAIAAWNTRAITKALQESAWQDIA